MDCIQLQALWDNQNTKQKVTSFFGFHPSASRQLLERIPPRTSGLSSKGVRGPRTLTAYANFKLATTHRVRVNDPAPDLLEIARTFGRLMAAMVDIPPIIQVMILLNALPHEFENISQILLQWRPSPPSHSNWCKTACSQTTPVEATILDQAQTKL